MPATSESQGRSRPRPFVGPGGPRPALTHGSRAGAIPGLLVRPGTPEATKTIDDLPSALAISDLIPGNLLDRTSDQAGFDAAEPSGAVEGIVEALVSPVQEPEAMIEVVPEPEAMIEVVPEPGELAADVAADVEVPPYLELEGELEGRVEAPPLVESAEVLESGFAVEPRQGALETADADVQGLEQIEPTEFPEAVAAVSESAFGVEVPVEVVADAQSGHHAEQPEVVPMAFASTWEPILEAGEDESTADEDLSATAEFSAPLDISPFDHETGERLSVVIENAPETLEALVEETDAQAAALEVLDQVARRVRSGELRVAPTGASAESVLASILAALLSPRS
ncbi:MAG: hypothetical protein IPK85_18170 [Gemmatimonadetes bacterium]|nr:hypothetical protein [Gemmatimonadota bacterium]